MKKNLLLAIILSFAFTGYAQQQKRTTYLTIWFDKKYEDEVAYYLMNAEKGNIAVPEVYELALYYPGRSRGSNKIDFYHKQNDSAQAYFNYFQNPTAGLEYIGKFGWQLVSVGNEVSSDYKYLREYGERFPITTVSTLTRYYLKKETE